MNPPGSRISNCCNVAYFSTWWHWVDEFATNNSSYGVNSWFRCGRFMENQNRHRVPANKLCRKTCIKWKCLFKPKNSLTSSSWNLHIKIKIKIIMMMLGIALRWKVWLEHWSSCRSTEQLWVFHCQVHHHHHQYREVIIIISVVIIIIIMIITWNHTRSSWQPTAKGRRGPCAKTVGVSWKL